jgi:hypothetical protein
MIDDGGPAYPCKTYPQSAEQVREIRDEAGVGLMQAKDWASTHSGMSLRDVFAMGLDVEGLFLKDISINTREILAGDEPQRPPYPSKRQEAEWEIKLLQWRMSVLSKVRYMYADAMIEARKETKNGS